MTKGPEVNTLLDQLNELLNDWDPIGVNETLREDGLPLEEYRSYAPGLLAMLQRGATSDEVAEHLYFLAAQQMGLATTKTRQTAPAERICAWYSKVLDES